MEREPGGAVELPDAAPTRVDGALREAATVERDRAEALAPALVGALAAAGPLLDPTDGSRRRMRSRALAGAAHPATDPGPGPLPRPAPRRTRVLAAVVAVAAVLGLGGTVALAARPGDAAFPLRAGAETAVVELSALGGSRSGAELDVAASRLADLPAAVSGGGADPAALTADLLDHVAAGSRAGVAAGVAGDVGQLVTVHDWAERQAADLAALRTRSPGARSAAVRRVTDVLTAVVARTDAIALRLACREITAGADRLGPLPATTACRPEGPAAGTGPALPVVAQVAVDGLRTAG